ncbi:hypothetical protein [Brachybacterium sp. Z12]|uniref:hypothetical protein n=1 Tax=Brachybacterium sp. Z12 TaxID=2759167 RepID=UPI00223A8F5E|nr:hypothetical protein [Brachybacterium sp. Z12]
MNDEQVSGALSPSRDAALSRPDFPFVRVAHRLGIDPAQAEVALRDDEKARAAVAEAVQAFLAADDDHRAGRPPSSAIALDPDFPTGVGMALVGAAVLWDARDLVPRVALRVAKDHFEDGADELAASYIALVQESVDPGRTPGTMPWRGRRSRCWSPCCNAPAARPRPRRSPATSLPTRSRSICGGTTTRACPTTRWPGTAARSSAASRRGATSAPSATRTSMTT